MDLSKNIEGILFWKGEPVSRKRLGEVLGASKEEIDLAIEGLRASLEGRGVVLQESGEEVTLGTAAELSSLIENLQKEELNKDLSRASLETISIILYRGEASRSEIDYIRGVNSSFILRALSVRGLIEKESDPKDSRRLLYRPSFELLSYLGVRSVQELPDWEEIKRSISNQERNISPDESEQ